MKKIGIIGGLSPESTLYYYRTLIDLCHENEQLRGTFAINYPDVIIYSVNLEDYYPLMVMDKWAELVDKITATLEALARAGADFALMSSNTPHAVFDDVKARSPIPLLSIVEETAKAVAKLGLSKVGLLGTQMTMRLHFYQDVFNKHNIAVVVPKEDEQTYIHDKIVTELAVGKTIDETRDGFLKIAQRMIDEESVQGLILGCTEIPLLLTREVLGIPFFDTAKIHVQSALAYAIS